jgi:hypothetical protein
MALIYTVYNFKRCINILGAAQMMQMLRNWVPKYPPAGPNGTGPLQKWLFEFIIPLYSPLKFRAA